MNKNTCLYCKHWNLDDLDFKPTWHNTRQCYSPKLLCPQNNAYEDKPDEDGAILQDGSYYEARLFTGPSFGCVNFEK